MKIAFGTVKDFADEVRRVCGESGSGLWQRQVRFSIDCEPEQKEAISFKVGLILTALAQTPDGEYIREYAELCGSDDPDVKPQDAGTQEARHRLAQVADVAMACNLAILPGKIEQF